MAYGYVRWRNWAHVVNGVCRGVVEVVVTSRMIEDRDFLRRCAAVVVARAETRHRPILAKYAELRRKHGFSLMLDYDDLLWDLQGRDTMMAHNKYKCDVFENGRFIESFIKDIDKFIVSTDFLGVCALSRFGRSLPVDVLPNSVSCSMFQRFWEHRGKPRIVYGGAWCHFDGDDVGDFAGPWLEALGRVRRKFEIHAFGTERWKFPEGTVVHPFATSQQWPRMFSSVRPDVCIGPLVDHPFNRCKSDIKMLESFAVGAVFVGSSFNDSPYNRAFVRVPKGCTVEELVSKLERLADAKERETIVKAQDKWMDVEHRWMEDDTNRDRFMKMVFGDTIEKR